MRQRERCESSIVSSARAAPASQRGGQPKAGFAVAILQARLTIFVGVIRLQIAVTAHVSVSM